MPRRCTKDQRLRLDAAYHSYEAGINDFESYDRKKAEILYEIYCVPDIQRVVGAEWAAIVRSLAARWSTWIALSVN